MTTILSLLGDAKGWLALLGGGLLAAFAAYLKGRSNGKAAERKKQERDVNEYLAETAEAHTSIDALPVSELDRQLRYPDGKLPSGG